MARRESRGRQLPAIRSTGIGGLENLRRTDSRLMPVQDVIRLTPDDLVRAIDCSRETAELWADPLSGAAVLHDINTHKRLAPWLATIAHESHGLTRLQENMNYSVNRLRQVWPSRFGPGKADPLHYAGQPEKLANYVYDDANRGDKNKLGNTQPGDGWRFIARGPIGITGRWNYERCGVAINVDLIRWPDFLLEPSAGALSAGWYCTDRKLNQFADADDFEGYTKAVNGGLVGWDDRLQRLHVAQSALGALA